MQRLALFILLTIPALTLAGVGTPPDPLPVPVPEPSTMGLLASGIVAIGLIGFLKKRNK